MKSNGDKVGDSNSDTHQEKAQGIQMEQAADSFGCSSSPDRKDLTSISKQEDALESVRGEMGVIREENERLKSLLSQIVNNYQSLQKHFHGALQQEEARHKKPAVPSHPVLDRSQEDEQEPDELVVSLTLGRPSSGLTKTDEHDEMSREERKRGLEPINYERSLDEPSKNQMSRGSFEQLKEEEKAEIWPPSKILKTMKSADNESSQPSCQVKKARVSVRARCDTPTMNDGCQWRKYGQKISKGNPCPRAYYRCTVSSSCPVRKQVQRCSDDMSILITTYEGSHNHQLPVSATAMASTTSAAASILQSRSSSSQQDREASTAITTSNNSISTTSAGLHGLNFSSSLGPKPNQLYISNSSISTWNSHPTITLDLTTPINASNYNRFSSKLFTSSVPKYSSTSPHCLNFSSSSPWESSSFLNYGVNPTNRSIQFHNGASSLGMQATQEHYYKPYSQESLITAATKVIATNPSFHSALAAALSSRVGNGTSGENFELKCLKLGGSSSEDSRQISSNLRPMNVELQPQAGLINLFPPSLSMTTSKDANPGPPTDSYQDRIEFLASSS